MHSHNVEETVLILEGLTTAQIGEETFDLVAGEATWVPAGVPHRFLNRGDFRTRIYCAHGGRDVRRPIAATDETFEHLSENDRGVTAIDTAPRHCIARPVEVVTGWDTLILEAQRSDRCRNEHIH